MLEGDAHVLTVAKGCDTRRCEAGVCSSPVSAPDNAGVTHTGLGRRFRAAMMDCRAGLRWPAEVAAQHDQSEVFVSGPRVYFFLVKNGRPKNFQPIHSNVIVVRNGTAP